MLSMGIGRKKPLERVLAFTAVALPEYSSTQQTQRWNECTLLTVEQPPSRSELLLIPETPVLL
jgi:hypothetical protein